MKDYYVIYKGYLKYGQDLEGESRYLYCVYKWNFGGEGWIISYDQVFKLTEGKQ
jgi:hypothetical protein